MSKLFTFQTNQYCEVCNIKGSFDFHGSYLCENCYKDCYDEEFYEDEMDKEFYCKCQDCRCGITQI